MTAKWEVEWTDEVASIHKSMLAFFIQIKRYTVVWVLLLSWIGSGTETVRISIELLKGRWELSVRMVFFFLQTTRTHAANWRLDGVIVPEQILTLEGTFYKSSWSLDFIVYLDVGLWSRSWIWSLSTKSRVTLENRSRTRSLSRLQN